MEFKNYFCAFYQKKSLFRRKKKMIPYSNRLYVLKTLLVLCNDSMSLFMFRSRMLSYTQTLTIAISFKVGITITLQMAGSLVTSVSVVLDNTKTFGVSRKGKMMKIVV